MSSTHKQEPIEQTDWLNITQDILACAQACGATAVEVGAHTESGFSVSVRMGEVETVEYHRDKGIGVTVYMGTRKGSASTSDTAPDTLRATVEAACAIARVTGEDPYAGLADKHRMATNYPDLDLYHPWEISAEQGIALALECESIARELDKRVINSEGVSLSTHQNRYIYANSHGFVGTYSGTQHGLNCILIAQSGSLMQRDYGYTVARAPEDLLSTSRVAADAVNRTVRRLGGRRLKSCRVPVLFEASVASSLIGHFLSAIRGGNLYRKATFLLDALEKPVFPAHIHIHEKPHLPKSLGGAPFDSEGVATRAQDFIKDGILQRYLLGSYSARKLGLESTGNAGGVHNLFIDTSQDDLTALMRQMGTGILVTELIGQGVNIVTGDYSRGIAGFWVENGEIQYPVEEITIAGNLRDMFLNLVAVGNDIDPRGNIQTGSILLSEMAVGGE